MIKTIKRISLVGVLLFSIACKRTEIDFKELIQGVEKYEVKEVTKPFQATQINISSQEMKTNGTEMFTDADNQEKDGKIILYTDELRSFNIKNMLEIKVIEGNKYRIRNFLPHTFKNLSVLLTIKGLEAPIKLGTIEEIPAFYFYEADLPLTDGEDFFEDINGKKISLERFKRLAASNFSLSFSGDDPMLEKINKINIDVTYTFRDYKQPDKWDKVYADDAKRYIPFLCNMWYVFSSEKFKNNLYAYEHPFRHGWKDEINAEGRKVDKNNPWTEAREKDHKELTKDEVYNGLLRKRTQNLGMIVQPGLNGLGGGASFGVARWIMLENFSNRKNIFWNPDIIYAQSAYLRQPMETFVHEFGHVLGYSHTGNMTYSYDYNKTIAKGFVPLFAETYRQMFLEKDLPFMEYPYKN